MSTFVTIGPGGDYSSLSTWEADCSKHQGCKEPEKHRLYKAMKLPCPCMPIYVTVSQIPIISNPTIKLDDIKKRRFNIIDKA